MLHEIGVDSVEELSRVSPRICAWDAGSTCPTRFRLSTIFGGMWKVS